MSVSDMNVSWSSIPTNRSTRSNRTGTSTSASVFLTSINSTRPHAQRPKCVSAKNAGMRFQSWREPKPLRSRCSSAVITESAEPRGVAEKVVPEQNSITELDKPKVTVRSAGRAPSSNNSREISNRLSSASSKSAAIQRLSQPTASSKWKTSTARAREVGTDMNYYSWSKMNVYKAYVGVIYASNGTMKRPKGNAH